MKSPSLIMGFSGWMDGGEVSTGTVGYMVEKTAAKRFAQIESEGFYLYNFPGGMDIAAALRPRVRLEGGLITSYTFPKNYFYYDLKDNIILFTGHEPSLAWEKFVDCVFMICREFNVEIIYFVGSVSGLIPHTREPRFLCSFSDKSIRDKLSHTLLKLSDYEGPASITNFIQHRASQENVKMVSLVAEIPAYVQGYNPKCVDAAVRLVSGLTGVHVNTDDLRAMGDEFEKRLDTLIRQQPDLAASIRKLEQDYDNEVFDTEMEDLKDWLEAKGIRLD